MSARRPAAQQQGALGDLEGLSLYDVAIEQLDGQLYDLATSLESWNPDAPAGAERIEQGAAIAQEAQLEIERIRREHAEDPHGDAEASELAALGVRIGARASAAGVLLPRLDPAVPTEPPAVSPSSGEPTVAPEPGQPSPGEDWSRLGTAFARRYG